MKVEAGTGVGSPKQYLRPYNSTDEFVRTSPSGSWVKLPTRAEMDAVNAKITDSLIRQYNTGASNTKLVITLNGQSSIDGIFTVFASNSISVYAIHAYSANGTSLSSETTVVNQKDGSAVSVSTSGTSISIPFGKAYNSGMICLSHSAGHVPTISYAS